MPLPLTAPVFSILRGLVEEKLGIHYSVDDRELFASKISARAIEAGFESLLDYYYFLRYDAAAAVEVDKLAEHLVVNETYFFRELDVLEVLVDQVVAPLAERQGRVRIWSAACSTGEEPLTLAMLLAARGLLGRTEILASDLSARVLGEAQRGMFGQRSVRRDVLPAETERWLLRRPDGTYQVSQDLVRRVRWEQINLLDRARIASLEPFDVVLCRNVLIYFSDEGTTRVIDTLCGALRNGGTLVVGVTESLLRYGTSLSCDELGGVFLYRKAAG